MILLAILVVVLVVLAPLAGIWALNTLFGLAIAYTWKTWLAVVVLVGLLNSGGSK